MAHLGQAGPLDTAALASLAIAGLREVSQSVVSAVGSTATTYTVAGTTTRRVVLLYTGSGATDIRFRLNAAAAATHMPLLPQRYVVVEAVAGETISLYNTTSTANVNVMETE